VHLAFADAVARQHHRQVAGQRQREAGLFDQQPQEDGELVVLIDEPQHALGDVAPELHRAAP
jgi:hypothetical protein